MLYSELKSNPFSPLIDTQDPNATVIIIIHGTEHTCVDQEPVSAESTRSPIARHLSHRQLARGGVALPRQPLHMIPSRGPSRPEADPRSAGLGWLHSSRVPVGARSPGPTLVRHLPHHRPHKHQPALNSPLAASSL